MKDFFIFIGGVLLKSVLGFAIGGVLKTTITKERAAIIEQHIFGNHGHSLKICAVDACAKL